MFQFHRIDFLIIKIYFLSSKLLSNHGSHKQGFKGILFSGSSILMNAKGVLLNKKTCNCIIFFSNAIYISFKLKNELKSNINFP